MYLTHKKNEEPKTRCIQCDMEFKSKKELVNHMKETHKTYKPCKNFKLNKCEYNQECLFPHIVLPEGHHICYKCGLIFATPTEVMKHIKEKHGNIICHKFMRGQCTYTKCLFSHPGKDAYFVSQATPTAQDFPNTLPTTSPVVGVQGRANPQ